VVGAKVELDDCEEEEIVTKDSEGRDEPSVITALSGVELDSSTIRVVQPPSVADVTKTLDCVEEAKVDGIAVVGEAVKLTDDWEVSGPKEPPIVVDN